MKFNARVSSQPRKKRKSAHTAPLHARGKFIRAPLSKALSEKAKKKTGRVRAGDKVKVMRGSFRKKEAVVERVDLLSGKIYLAGLARKNAKGQEKFAAIEPSNVMILEKGEAKKAAGKEKKEKKEAEKVKK